MVTSSADRHLVPFIPDDTGDPCRTTGIFLCLLAAPVPHGPALSAGEVLRQRHRAHRVCTRQVTVGQSSEHRRRQMHDANFRPARPSELVSLLLGFHRTSMPGALGRAGPAPVVAKTSDCAEQRPPVAVVHGYE